MKKTIALISTLLLATVVTLWLSYTRLPMANRTEPVIAVVFDMGNVLFEENSTGIALELGIVNLGMYMLRERVHKDDVKKRLVSRLYEVMYHLGRQSPATDLIATHEGYELPHIFCEWQRGNIKSNHLIATLLEHIKQLKKQGWFHSKREYKMLRTMIKVIHNPTILARNLRPIKSGWELVKKCKELGFKVCILSNFDPETFILLKAQYKYLFDTYIDEIVISGEVHAIKPEPVIYEHLLNRIQIKYNITADQCWFIDDTPNNITAAQRMSINALLCENKQFDTVIAQLQLDLPWFALA